MRKLIPLAVALFCACGGAGSHRAGDTVGGALTCDNGDTLTYGPRFSPAAGASGVATPADAQAGYVSSDAKANGATATAPMTDPTDGPLTAMVTSCAPSTCGAGQVAVTIPPPASGGGATAGDFAGPTAGPTAPPSNQTPPDATTKCAPPPPACPTGQSPQYTNHDTWECTDCGLIVTYGGIYGNYRRCVSSPTIVCPTSQVPTFSYDNENWECKPTCDNGMYDQHTINGQLVCVPC